MNDWNCSGCSCDRHTCQPDASGYCSFYCTDCTVQLWAMGVEAHADLLLDQLQAMHRVNPHLLIDFVRGAITFEAACQATDDVDPPTVRTESA